jgi:outer membrane protein assembly factor BamB
MTAPTPDSTPRTRRFGRPWFPLVTLALGIGGVFFVQSLPELERNLKGWITAAIPLLVLTLNLLWFLLTPRFSWRTRLAGLAVVVLLGFAAKAALRVNGTVDGTGLPRLAWKWTPRAKPRLNAAAPASPAATPAVQDPRLAQATAVPQFFGARRDGIARGATLSSDWQTTPPKPLWRQAIGEGWSAFAVVQGRAYTLEQRDDEELVTCYDLFTGTLLWAHADKARFSQWQSGDGPHSTPTVDAGRVYAYGGTGLLNCLDAATGKPLWQRNVLKEHHLENLEWGISASPLLVDDKVIVTGGNTLSSVLFAYHRDTGEPVWKGGYDRATYASPVLTRLAGRPVILCNHARALTAHDPATGAVVMEHPWGVDKWPKASQPVVVNEDRVFISAGYGMGCRLLHITAADAGKLTATEIWSGMKMKTQFNSAAMHQGHLYGIDDGRLACIDLATGERLWKDGRFASGQSLIAGGLILIQNENGPVHLAAASPSGFQELGRIEALSSKTWNHPTLAGRYLLVRNDREAVCYELPVSP